MPNASYSTANARTDQRLSQLVKLKRLERPDPAFWQAFEQEFRSKQLSSLVQVQPLHTRIFKACQIAARKVAPPVAAASALTITVVAVHNFSHLAEAPSDNLKSSAYASSESDSISETQAYFVVQEQESTQPSEQSIQNDGTIYQMNVLSHRAEHSETYQLNATPVTFRYQGQTTSGGINSISEQTEY